MRRPLTYVLAWSLATLVAMTGAWVGLQPLLAAASPELPARLPASQLREVAPAPTGPPTPTPPPSPSPEPEEPAEPPEPPEPVPTVPPAAEQPVTSQWREIDDTNRYERVFVVRGGEAEFRVGRRSVTMLDHTANSGYEVSLTRWSRSSLVLSFESEEHTSRIWVMWRDGGPYAEVTETA